MIYTRHFYRVDEVKAALQYEIHRKRLVEAFFWITELIDSYEFEAIEEVLLKSWFYDIGLANIDILYYILLTPSNDSSVLYEIINTMINSKRDCTLPIVFLYGISNNKYKNKNIVFTLPDDLIQDDITLDTMIRACYLGKYLEAWYLSISLWDTNNKIQLYLERIIKHKCKNPIFLTIINFLKNIKTINKWYIRCAIITIICCGERIYSNTTLKNLDKEHSDTIHKWELCLTKKVRRLLSIPAICLYGITYRGTTTYSDNNMNELNNIEILLTNQQIYEEIIDKFGTYENFVDDASEYEAFVDSYFPNDIPDEWSLKEKEKSHGIGVNQKSDTPSIRKYFNRWVELKNNSMIWDKETIVNNCLQMLQNEFESFYIEKEICEKYDLKSEKKNTFNMKSIQLILSTLEIE